MAWAFVQRNPSSGTPSQNGASPLNIGPFGSAVTLNNFVVVWAWGGANSAPTSGQVTCSDNGTTPNSYSQLVFINQSNSTTFATIFVAKITSNPGSGNLNPKITCSTAGAFLVGTASEFSGGTTTTDGSSTNSQVQPGTPVNPSCGNMTTTVANDLLLACFGLEQSSNITITADPSGYSLSGETGSEVQCAGSGVYKIAAGTVTNNNPSWTCTGMLGSSPNGWSAVQVALQPAASAPAWAPRFFTAGYDPLAWAPEWAEELKLHPSPRKTRRKRQPVLWTQR